MINIIHIIICIIIISYLFDKLYNIFYYIKMYRKLKIFLKKHDITVMDNYLQQIYKGNLIYLNDKEVFDLKYKILNNYEFILDKDLYDFVVYRFKRDESILFINVYFLKNVEIKKAI